MYNNFLKCIYSIQLYLQRKACCCAKIPVFLHHFVTVQHEDFWQTFGPQWKKYNFQLSLVKVYVFSILTKNQIHNMFFININRQRVFQQQYNNNSHKDNRLSISPNTELDFWEEYSTGEEGHTTISPTEPFMFEKWGFTFKRCNSDWTRAA